MEIALNFNQYGYFHRALITYGATNIHQERATLYPQIPTSYPHSTLPHTCMPTTIFNPIIFEAHLIQYLLYIHIYIIKKRAKIT